MVVRDAPDKFEFRGFALMASLALALLALFIMVLFSAG